MVIVARLRVLRKESDLIAPFVVLLVLFRSLVGAVTIFVFVLIKILWALFLWLLFEIFFGLTEQFFSEILKH